MSSNWNERFEGLRKRVAEIERNLGMAGTERQTATETMMMEDFKRWQAAQTKPDLPLNVRVAKVLGHQVLPPNKYDPTEHWRVNPGNLREGDIYPRVPDYDKHVDLAMGAFWEHLKQNDYFGAVFTHKDGSLSILIEGKTVRTSIDEPPAKAICEAIAKYAERSK